MWDFKGYDLLDLTHFGVLPHRSIEIRGNYPCEHPGIPTVVATSSTGNHVGPGFTSLVRQTLRGLALGIYAYPTGSPTFSQ